MAPGEINFLTTYRNYEVIRNLDKEVSVCEKKKV